MWEHGSYKNYTFEAKVYEQGSQFGINQGRISKLQIKDDDKVVAHYDRGWDIRPKLEHKNDVKEIIDVLEMY